jgi:hypothetical protein
MCDEEEIIQQEDPTDDHKEKRRLRRKHKERKERRIRKIVTRHYVPHVGYVSGDWIDGEFIEKPYVQRSGRSGKQRWIKRHTSRLARRRDDYPDRNGYRRLVDYWWTMY